MDEAQRGKIIFPRSDICSPLLKMLELWTVSGFFSFLSLSLFFLQNFVDSEAIPEGTALESKCGKVATS